MGWPATPGHGGWGGAGPAEQAAGRPRQRGFTADRRQAVLLARRAAGGVDRLPAGELHPGAPP